MDQILLFKALPCDDKWDLCLAVQNSKCNYSETYTEKMSCEFFFYKVKDWKNEDINSNFDLNCVYTFLFYENRNKTYTLENFFWENQKLVLRYQKLMKSKFFSECTSNFMFEHYDVCLWVYGPKGWILLVSKLE